MMLALENSKRPFLEDLLFFDVDKKVSERYPEKRDILLPNKSYAY